ncbi:MAG: hypothetical protein QM723_10390 [Myxococcaceae bacterium]
MFEVTRRRSLFAVIAVVYALVSLGALAAQKMAGPMDARVRYQAHQTGDAKVQVETAVKPELTLTFTGHF